MSESVKARRTYSSPRHAELRRQTRRAVVAAARKLFSDRGYNTTTIEALAEEAGVAVQTVYAAFGNKRSVLWALLETSVAGDDAERTIGDRVSDALAGIDDPGERLDRVLAFGREIIGRSADVHRILRGAAAADPDLRTALDEVEQRRLVDARTFVEMVTSEHPTRGDLDHAADVFFTLTSYEVYEMLVEHRGWSPDRWQQWVRDAVEVAIASRG